MYSHQLHTSHYWEEVQNNSLQIKNERNVLSVATMV